MMQSQKKYTLIVTQLSEGDNMKRQKTMTPEDASKYCAGNRYYAFLEFDLQGDSFI